MLSKWSFLKKCLLDISKRYLLDMCLIDILQEGSFRYL